MKKFYAIIALVSLALLALIIVSYKYIEAPAKTPVHQQEVTITDTNTGQIISVHKGDEVTLVLHSTYWQNIQSSNAAILQFMNSTIAPVKGALPGTGAGTITTIYKAVQTGTTVISASRTSCGEALACGSGNGSFSVAIDVTN